MSPVLYRRGSFFWALILIAVGVIFLLQNFNPAVHPWEIVARYWPLLIIIWGISKLADYLQARAHPEITPPPMFSGADVVLLILILILGTIMSHLVLAPWHQWRTDWGMHWSGDEWHNPFLNSYTYTRSISATTPDRLHLVVNEQRGDIALQGTDASGINAMVKETVRAANEQDAARMNRQLALTIVNDNGSYALRPDFASLPDGGQNLRLDIALHVPRDTAAELTTRDGDILVTGLHGKQVTSTRTGDVHMNNVQGEVQLEEAGGSADVRNVKGSIDVSGRGADVQVVNATGPVSVNGEFTGLMRFERLDRGLQFTSSRTHLTAQRLVGKLEMQMGSLEATNVDGPLEVVTRHKDISIASFQSAVNISDDGANIVLQAAKPPTEPIVVNSKNGDIELTLPPSSRFVVDAVSQKGQVESDFSAPSLLVESQGNQPSIKGTYGKGGPRIHLFTSYGTVHLIRGGATPSRPAAGTTEQTKSLGLAAGDPGTHHLAD
jgi:DUF4097 and DUF4098 domain-containing protein YvlB